MKKILLVLTLLSLAVTGCAGYKMKTENDLPFKIKTVYVPTVKNKIPLERLYIYVPGMEVGLTNAIISRFNHDGVLKVVSRKEDADATLLVDLIGFDQEPTRFTNLESVEEYRLFITTRVRLKDNRTDEVLLEESNFTGKTSYFVEVSQYANRNNQVRLDAQESLKSANVKAVEDYAHNVVDLVTEAW